MQIDVEGAESIALVAKRVRQLGAGREVLTNMTRNIRRSVGPPVRTAVRASALATLPHSGGLGAWVARVSVLVRVRRSASNAGVSVTAGRNASGHRADIKAIDAGNVRHKAWGHAPWSAQSVPAGFFSDAVTEEGMTAFREAVVAAVNQAAAEVLG